MKRYLCPVCEQELTGRSYCRICRKVVREPMIYDGVLPNESRVTFSGGAAGQNRSASPETSGKQSGTTTSGTVYQDYVPSQSNAPGSQIWKGSTTGGNTTYRNNTYSSSRTEPRKKKGCRAGCLVVVLVIWLIGILGELLSEIDIDSWLPEDWYAEESIDWIPDESNEFWENWEEADYEEILKVGKPCDGYWHYHIDGDEVYDTLANYAQTELKLTMTEESEWMENGISQTEHGTYSYYDTFCYWDWQDGYLGVTCDSVTNEIHYVSAYGVNEKEIFAIMVKAIELVEDAGAAEMIEGQLAKMNKNGQLDGGVYLAIGDSELWAELEEDGWLYIEVYPVNE